MTKDDIIKLAMHQVSEFAQAQEQAEPTCPSCKAAVLYECIGCSSKNYPPQQQQAEPPPEWPLIKNILDEYGLQAICFVAEWKAAQRPWVGLTDEDFLEACQLAERGNYLLAFQRIQIKLKERNT